MLARVHERSDTPGYWDFTPKGKPGSHFRMINLGNAISISEGKAVKIYEYWQNRPQELWDILQQAYDKDFAD